MTIIATRLRLWTAAALTAAVLTACGGNGSSSPAPNTPTPARTATLPPAAAATPTATASTGGFSGLVVINHAVLASASDALGAPPPRWGAPADATSFDRSLAAANWSIDGSVQGVTGADGSFTTGPLAPGAHTLQISKTLDGNLAALSIPFTVGDDGSTTLVVEVSWGQVRAVATFVHNGTPVEQIRGPSGSWLTLTGGLVSAFGDANRSFTNPSSSNGSFVCTLPDGSTCPPAGIQAVAITAGPTQLFVGQQGSLSAVAQLSDGTTIDVTTLASWQSSDDTVTVDSWGTVSALAIGNASITATLGTLTSTPWPLAVTGMPPLQKIDVENASCLYPLVNAGAVPPAVAATMPPARTDVLPVPNCTDVVQIGSTLQFRAIGEFAGDSVQDITNQVQWQVTPADVGTGVTGLFTAVQAGTAQLTASLDGVASDPTQITVVTQPTVVAITIYAENSGIPVVSANTGGTGSAPAPVASCVAAPPDTAESVGPCCCPPPMLGIAAPCHCSYGLTVLVGDQLQFHATAQYDTGAWADVTNQVIWQSSTPQAASIDASGVMTALQAGDTSITAALGSVASDPDDVHVVDHATVQALSIYGEGQDLVVATGAQLFFHAVAGYDVGISREVTADATWQSSDDSVGGFDTPGVFTGRAAGAVQVWATLDGVQSNQISLQVFATSELSYCDPHNINRAVWTDNFNRVTLESDCASYAEPGVASLRYTVTEIQPHGGVFNPCLDLYVLQGHTPVRTIRNQGCGMPFLAPNAPNAGAETVKYQLLAFWDLKDDAGNPVAPGTYTIAGQFYLYYDPVVRLDITVLAPGQPTPAPITPEPTRSATPAAVCTPPPCPNGGTLVCPKGGQPIGTAGNGGLGCCPLGWFLYGCTFPDGGTGFACHDPALGCASSEVCGQGCDPVVTGACDECAGGCGYLCVLGTPAPTPTPEGACFTGPPNCAGGSFPSSQEACCKLSLSGAMPGVVSWCAITNFDPSSGTCGACADPCAGLPTPAPTPTVPSCCQSDVGGLCDMGVICPPPTPGGCALACDDRPCVSTCADGSLAKGTCSALTVDRGCQCAPDCAPGTPVPTPKPPPAQCTSLLPCAGKCTIFPTCTPGGACPQFVILGTCQLVADTCTCVSSNSTPLPLTTPTPQCTGAPCGGSCVISSPPFPCPPGAICNSTQGPDVPVQLGQCEVTTAGNCDCAPMDTPTPTPTPTGGQCSGVMCGGPCTICPPCTPDTVCPEIPCRLGACQADASGGCSCVADVSTPTPTPAQTCVTDSDCNDGNVCTADQCVGGVCEHACICLTTTGAQTCCAGPAALCVLPCGADAAGTCSGVCPAGASCESLPTAAPGCGCVSGVGGPCGGNLFTAPPVCATGLVCQQSLPDVTGVCVAPNCISLFASGCSQTSDCCEPCGNETHAPCGVCINGTCVGAP